MSWMFAQTCFCCFCCHSQWQQRLCVSYVCSVYTCRIILYSCVLYALRFVARWWDCIQEIRVLLVQTVLVRFWSWANGSDTWGPQEFDAGGVWWWTMGGKTKCPGGPGGASSNVFQDRRGCVWWSAWLLKHLLPSSFARNLEPDAETRRCRKILEFHSICLNPFSIFFILSCVLHVSGSRSLLTQKPPSWSFEEVSKWERFCEGRMNLICTEIFKSIAVYSRIMDLEGRKLRKWIKNLESGASIGHEPSF